jgi:hypothetical protein
MCILGNSKNLAGSHCSGMQAEYNVQGIQILRSFNYLTPWNRVLFEELRVARLGRKFSSIYGTRRFITVVTKSNT